MIAEDGGKEVTIWITRDVLETGRIVTGAGHRCFGSPNLVNYNSETYSPGDYALTEGVARMRAEHLRVEALRKARAEVERLERMEF